MRMGRKGRTGEADWREEMWRSSNRNNRSNASTSDGVQIPCNVLSVTATLLRTCYLTHTLCQHTFKHDSIIEVVSLNHGLSSFYSLCAWTREVNLSVSAVCCHLSAVGLLSSCSLVPLPLKTHNKLLDHHPTRLYGVECVCVGVCVLAPQTDNSKRNSHHTLCTQSIQMSAHFCIDTNILAHIHSWIHTHRDSQIGGVIFHTYTRCSLCVNLSSNLQSGQIIIWQAPFWGLYGYAINIPPTGHHRTGVTMETLNASSGQYLFYLQLLSTLASFVHYGTDWNLYCETYRLIEKCNCK